jgi:hypothetical protein
MWTPVLTAAVGSVFLVAAFFLLLPPRHSAAAASADARRDQLALEPAVRESPPATDLAPCPPAPSTAVAPATTPPDQPEPVAEAPAQVDAPQRAEVAANPFVKFSARAPAGTPGCQQCGTAVDFYDSPAIANKNALKDNKLVFVLHVAGNFEEPGFT